LNVASSDLDDGSKGPDVFNSQHHGTEVRQAPVTVRISGMIAAGWLIHKVPPVYPPIAIASRTEGTVVLQATISRTGSIENLHILSGPLMLQNAAITAVQQWQYKPYLLSGDPVEVETTVNVIFKLN